MEGNRDDELLQEVEEVRTDPSEFSFGNKLGNLKWEHEAVFLMSLEDEEVGKLVLAMPKDTGSGRGIPPRTLKRG